ncbi:uncharacterized protein LOC129773577 [Toxorhynchites rutilus septentrionalis]|uniref:uncharacterized protein LOC129773577 n=1 Tax=Toxorhynchites rutilus septentrionalis TaxID=329112 RepID=UPI002479C489|nr:uncharacterized protein LOC129773577 [Toxorhynchites rutilus septentrionalis]
MVREKLNQKFRYLLNFLFEDPKKFVRIVVLSVCCVVVIFQLTECFRKLIRPPVSTHFRFELNDTMVYPAITLCRDPPYKYEVLRRFNLTLHPKYANAFDMFNFNESSLEELFREATYNEDEFFIAYALNQDPENIKTTPNMHLNLGNCFTLDPLVTTSHTWRDAGYSIFLQHDSDDDYSDQLEDVPGWHVFIHDRAEGFAENRAQSSGRVEYLFLEVNEQIEVKMTAQHLHMLPSENLCTTVLEMSSTRCSELCHWRHVVNIAGCTGPWMPDIEQRTCSTSNETQQLIKHYQLLESLDSSVCGCYQPCTAVIYTTFVMNRKRFNISVPAGHIWLYYTSKMVTFVEEFHGYDLAQFVADMGGSLGFLLGLSVLGLIGLIGKITEILCLRNLIPEEEITEKQCEAKNSQ